MMAQMKPSTFGSIARHLICFGLTARALFFGMCKAAQRRRLLPRLTLTLPIYAIAHWWFISTSTLRLYSCYLLAIAVVLCTAGWAILILMYRHSITTVFNRKVPTISESEDKYYWRSPHPAVQSFNEHLLMVRPLELLFRFITAPLRVLPDVLVLGETRCGTTNLCAILSSSLPDEKIKCYTPFSSLAHPELDHKESFYLVGHYLGIVDPYFYRMAFPLKLTRWWQERVLGNIFFCFDGSAQYLTSPTVPYLIASAYQGGNESPPVLVACIRRPVDQAISWWRFENNAMTWGEEMGLNVWNAELRSSQYPPKSIVDALQFAHSEFVQTAYTDAEKLVQKLISNDVAKRPLFRLMCLPSWAITWPAGQLSTIGRSGKYAENIERYKKVFMAAHPTKSQPQPSTSSSERQIGLVHTVPIECQSSAATLKTAIRPVLSDVVHRSSHRRKVPYATLMSSMDKALDKLCTDESFEVTRRNSCSLTNAEIEPSQEDILLLEKYFERETKWYFEATKVVN